MATKIEGKKPKTKGSAFKGSIASKGKGVANYVRGLEEKFEPGMQVPLRTGDTGHPLRDLGIKYTDEGDFIENERFGTKWNLASAAHPAALSDGDVNYLLKKKYAAELAKYDTFVWNMIPGADPMSSMFRNKLAPDFVKRQKDTLARNLAIEKKFVDVMTDGVQSQEDMMFVFAVANGEINLPTGPAWNPRFGRQADEAFTAHFQRGIWNVRRVVRGKRQAGIVVPAGSDMEARFGNLLGSQLGGRGDANLRIAIDADEVMAAANTVAGRVPEPRAGAPFPNPFPGFPQ